MEEKDQPQVGKVLQPSDRFGTITGGQQLKGGPRFRYQAGLPRNAELFLKTGMYRADGCHGYRHAFF
jgi:hypothetical protein